MTGVQHKIIGIATGFTASAIATKHGADGSAWIMLAMSGVGCMLPDIDHNATKIGRSRKFVVSLLIKAISVCLAAVVLLAILSMYQDSKTNEVDYKKILIPVAVIIIVLVFQAITKSKAFKWCAKHRGIMHTLVPLGGLFYLTTTLQDNTAIYWAAMGITVGYASHLFADCCTYHGCPLLFPILPKVNIRLLLLRTSSQACTVFANVLALVIVTIGFKFGF